MWMIAGWSGLHVQPHRRNRSPNHAEGLCDSRVARQPCSPNVPGIYEVGHEYVSLVCVFRGLGEFSWVVL